MEEIEQLSRILGRLRDRLKELKREQRRLSKRGFTVRYVRCGKENCRKCAEGRGHGPYVYRTVREGKRVRSVYLGKLSELKTEETKRLGELEEEVERIERTLNYVRKVLRKLIVELAHI